jgi:hypothetical protein
VHLAQPTHLEEDLEAVGLRDLDRGGVLLDGAVEDVPVVLRAVRGVLRGGAR